jgi:hypothetical protein
MSVKGFYYPMKDLIGEPMCYLLHMGELHITMMSQMSSFFISLFRYICIIHNERLLALQISVKVLAKVIFALLFCVPLYFVYSIQWPFPEGAYPPLDRYVSIKVI